LLGRAELLSQSSSIYLKAVFDNKLLSH
jgi:hypothetical protein